ncbi:MAG: DegT/DnrJ/EryC1/StrS family aminotransferase [Gammaproteobacteria bacterium]|nr:DegT/DnrJ/EryC1/StrS family aminotransferase [Gammaproteobacteria bacterium]
MAPAAINLESAAWDESGIDAKMNYPIELMNPAKHMKPCIRISPFNSGKFEAGGAGGSRDSELMRPEFWLNGGDDFSLLPSGRAAIRLALLSIGVQRGDSVLIITTTGGSYISSCVTETIEEVCQWSRQLQDNTKAALLIHEFGFPCVLPREVAEAGIKIIEDCAYAVGTRIEGGKVGMMGDFAVYSLPKYYPIPFGGILVSRHSIRDELNPEKLSAEGVEFLANYLASAAAKHSEWNRLRCNNWQFFSNHLEKYRMDAYFEMDDDVVPGVFIARLPSDVDGAKIKDGCVNAGIESTEYYGNGGYYFPVHQCLTGFEKDYILYHLLKNAR